jgi:hypothetical protein
VEGVTLDEILDAVIALTGPTAVETSPPAPP